MTDLRRRKVTLGVGVAALTFALASCAKKQEAFLATDITGVEWGRDFRLADSGGRARMLSDFRGKAVLLFFGYTHCPDACPTTLARMAQAVDRMGKDGARVQGLFVTLDPARDTAQVLARYVPAFHPSFIGLRGTEDEIARTAEEFKVFFARQPPDASGNYSVDHLSALFAFDHAGRLRLYIMGETDPVAIAHDLGLLLQP